MADTFRSKMASLSFSENIKILDRGRGRLIARIREKLKAERLKERKDKESK